MAIKLKDLPLEMQKRLLRLPDGPPGCWDVLISNWRPIPLNKLMKLYHLRQAAAKREDYEVIAAALHKSGVTAAVGRRKVTYTAIYSPGERRCDKDAFWKVLLDGLEFCGALVTDGPKWCELGEPGAERAAERGFRILIEDVRCVP